MQDFNDLYYFACVVKQGGFSEASRLHGIPRSTLSRRLIVLEERLGVRLIQRSTRSFTVTETGWEYYRYCRAMIENAQAAQAVVNNVKVMPRGKIRISCPVLMLQHYVGEIICRFMKRYPEVSVEIKSTNRIVDVIEEGFDVALRVLPPPLENSDLIIKSLGLSTQLLVASPEFLKRNGVPDLPSELQKFALIGGRKRNHRYGEWQLHDSQAKVETVQFEPRLATDDLHLAYLAAQEGLGIAVLPVTMVKDCLKSGRLITVLEEWQPVERIIHAIYPSRNGVLPSVKYFLDYLKQELGKH
ncbi:LysR substrate-binding domain-containing protein [Rahnella laticis]|uniref:LysR substrate-binding domain-containing protein n=1 Tax=Rahnella laticis TaxID=2787622 RepID=UPI0018A33946|nr:LysR substrate-binding domain-containing protein [Rahnella laticis]MBF7997529.1 LysR family transcriptional regulator [Rahnella laticis]